MFFMYLRCCLALPKHRFVLRNESVMKLLCSAAYFAFAVFVAYAQTDDSSLPSNSTMVHAENSSESAPLIGLMKYVGILVAFEFLMTPVSLFIPYFSKARMPLHLPHVLERFGCFLLVVMGEIALGISQYLPTAGRASEAAVYTQSFIVLWALLLFKLLYFDLAEVHIDDHAMRISLHTGYAFSQVHVLLFGATALLGSCVDILVLSAMTDPSPTEDCTEDESTFDASGTSLLCGSIMLSTVLLLQCLHRGVHTHRTVAEDIVHLECEIISLEQEKQHADCAVDIQTFKGLLRTLDDPADVKRIFGKDLVLSGAPTDANKAEAKEKQLADVFNMFAINGSNTLGAKELQSLHKFLTDAAIIDKKVLSSLLVVIIPLASHILSLFLLPSFSFLLAAHAVRDAVPFQQSPAAAVLRVSHRHGIDPPAARQHRCGSFPPSLPCSSPLNACRCTQRAVSHRRKVFCCRCWRVQPFWNIRLACCHLFCRAFYRLGAFHTFFGAVLSK
jgi:hypothetical protein